MSYQGSINGSSSSAVPTSAPIGSILGGRFRLPVQTTAAARRHHHPNRMACRLIVPCGTSHTHDAFTKPSNHRCASDSPPFPRALWSTALLNVLMQHRQDCGPVSACPQPRPSLFRGIAAGPRCCQGRRFGGGSFAGGGDLNTARRPQTSSKKFTGKMRGEPCRTRSLRKMQMRDPLGLRQSSRWT